MQSPQTIAPMLHRWARANVRGAIFSSRSTSAGWAMPVSLNEILPGNESPMHLPIGAPHAVMRRVSGTGLRCVLPCGATLEEVAVDAFLMKTPGRDIRLSGSGPLLVAEFALQEDLLRSVATDCFGRDAAERSDLLSGGRPVRRDAQLVAMLDEYLRLALREDEEPARIEMDSRAILITLRLLRAHSVIRQNPSFRSRGGLAPWRLRRACEAMTHDLAASISMHALADMVEVSYHHFCHAFKESVGMAPHQWLVERRVERACELLRATRDSVGDIAAAVGYEDPNQLARVFKSRRGISPLAYRRECGILAGHA